MQAGRIIRLIRDADGIPQEQLASDLKVTRAYLSQVENGREPSLAFLREAAKRLNVPLPLLVAGEDEGDPELVAEIRKLVESLLAARITLWSGSGGRGQHG